MRKISAEMPSNPQQNHRGVESKVSLVVDVGTGPGPACTMPRANGGPGGRVMRAVSFFGPGWLGTRPAGFGSGCKIGEAVTCAGISGDRRNGSCRYSARGSALSDDAGGARSGRMTGVVSGLWGSAGSAITNQVAPEKSLKILSLSLAKFFAKEISRPDLAVGSMLAVAASLCEAWEDAPLQEYAPLQDKLSAILASHSEAATGID